MDMRTGRTRPLIPQTPLLSSNDADWRGVHVEEHDVGPFEVDQVCTVNHLVGLQLTGPVHLEWQSDGRREQVQVVPGQVGFIPAGTAYSLRSRTLGRFVTASIEPQSLARAGFETIEGSGVELIPAIGKTDSLVQGIIQTLRTELANGGAGSQVYAETLGNTLAVHLLRRYASEPAKFGRPNQGGLARHQLRRAMEYIHENLEGELSLDAIARAVGISPFHFCRMFKKSTRFSPHQYVLKCRVEHARKLLLDPQRSIADVARQLGFCDQSHLAIHFKRMFGVTPRTFVRHVLTH